MRIDVEADFPTSPRFKRLVRRVARGPNEVLGAILNVWIACANARSPFQTTDDVDAAADIDGFALAMIAAELAEAATAGDVAVIDIELPNVENPMVTATADGVRVRGVADRIAFRFKQQAKGRLSGDARKAAKVRRELEPRLEPMLEPRLEPRLNQPVEPSALALSLTLSPDPKKKKRERQAASLPLGPEWQPDEGSRKLARECGLDLGAEADKFRLHAKAKGRRQVDWDASFRLWLRRSYEYGGQRPQQQENIRRYQDLGSEAVGIAPSQREIADGIRAAIEKADAFVKGTEPKDP